MADAPRNLASPLESGKTSPRKRGSGGVAAVAVLLIVAGSGIWWGFVRRRDVSPENPQPTAPARTVLPLESFTVNLADPEEGRFLRATLALGVEGQLPTIAKGENKPVETT